MANYILNHSHIACVTYTIDWQCLCSTNTSSRDISVQIC